MANPTLTPFPTPPLPEQDEVTFNRNAANSLLAQANFVGEANTVVTWMGQQVDAVSTNAAAALKSSKDAAASSTAASGSADSAANSASQAQTYAAAAGAAAGAPSISGKADYMYSVNAAGNGTEWRAAPLRPSAASAGKFVRYNAAGTGFDVGDGVKYFESAQQQLGGTTAISVAHGLGAMPKGVSAFIVCTTAEGGFAVGDRVEINPSAYSWYSGGNMQCGISIKADQSSVTFRSGNNITLLSQTSNGGYFIITNSNWRLVMRAWT